MEEKLTFHALHFPMVKLIEYYRGIHVHVLKVTGRKY